MKDSYFMVVALILCVVVIAALAIYAWRIKQALEAARGGVATKDLQATQDHGAACALSPESDAVRRQQKLERAAKWIVPALKWMIPAMILIVASYEYWPASKTQMPGLEGPGQPFASQNKSAPGQANSGGDLNEAAKQLAEKLAKNPDNGEGWVLLGKTYAELKAFQKAADAYEKASEHQTLGADVLADWIDASVMANQGQWNDKARKLLQRALSSDAKHIKTLALAGSEAFERGKFKEAIDYWNRLKKVADKESMYFRLAEANIAEAEARLSGKTTQAPAVSSSGISGTVTIASKLSREISEGDTVFVYVRSAEGGNTPPIAAKRFKATELPIQFVLDDEALLLPGKSLATVGAMVIGAKLSHSVDAGQHKNDIISEMVPVAYGQENVKLELSKLRQ